MKKLSAPVVRAIHERFPHQVAMDLIAWLERAFQPAKVLARPPRSVREALGEDLVDELMDYIIAVHNGARLNPSQAIASNTGIRYNANHEGHH